MLIWFEKKIVSMIGLPIGVEWFLYTLHGHGPLFRSITSSLMLHCWIQLLDEPHSENNLKSL